MKILVTGCEGMLGRAVVARLGAHHVVRGVGLAQGDLTKPEHARSLVVNDPPEWIVNCAAWTGVDAAEDHRDEAMAANALIPANLAAVCGELGCGLTQISTDYVFPGNGDGFDEDSPRCPVNFYGLTKYRGDEAVQSMAAPWQIVRTSWLFGDGPQNFVRTITKLLRERPSLTVVNDQRGNPTYTEDLAAVLEHLVTGGYRGIFHGTNAGACTWFEFARAIAEENGCDPEGISPCASEQYPTPAARPRCSVLRSSRLEAVGCGPRPAWRDALHRYCGLLASGRAAFPLA